MKKDISLNAYSGQEIEKAKFFCSKKIKKFFELPEIEQNLEIQKFLNEWKESVQRIERNLEQQPKSSNDTEIIILNFTNQELGFIEK